MKKLSLIPILLAITCSANLVADLILMNINTFAGGNTFGTSIFVTAAIILGRFSNILLKSY